MTEPLLKLVELIERAEATEPNGSLTLPFELRQKSRLRARLDDGREVGVVLPRGHVLREGDQLRAATGEVIVIRSALERVSEAHAADAPELARTAYHLGNRHVALQVGAGWVRYQHDHVLDDMVKKLGVRLVVRDAPFEPEPGAYGGHSHSHGHSHDHGHSHGHSHGHARDQGLGDFKSRDDVDQTHEHKHG